MPENMLTAIRKLLWKDKRSTVEDPVDTELPSHIINNYEELLYTSLPYYNTLTAEEKDRFLKRLYRLHQSKNFHFIGMPEIKEAPVLISAVAVQITFGLKKFMLSFFRDIYITPGAYQLQEASEPYIGHVSPKGIYISWKHFGEGFSITDDRINVAYHELAHALHHENFAHEKGIDWEFRKDFAKVSHVFGPALASSLKEKQSYLRGYAFTDFYEFWAVSVESFFEDPNGLLKNMPHLYKIISETLNQDPLRSPKVLAANH